MSAPARKAQSRKKTLPRGMASREVAVSLLRAVLAEGKPLDEAWQAAMSQDPAANLSQQDRAFVRAILATTLRRKGQLEQLLHGFLDRPLPRRAGPLPHILLAAMAQLLFLDTPPHAAISLAVSQTRAHPKSRHFSGLVNAVLRRCAREGASHLAQQDAPRVNTPDWLWERWSAAYGEATCRQIAEAHLAEPPLDITVKSDPETWAARLDAEILPTGSLRRWGGGRIESLPGFSSGAWWVQDMAAALPVRLAGDLAGKRALDMRAAPGGKPAQLLMAGAHVTALDAAPHRLARLNETLSSLRLSAQTFCTDATQWQSDGAFDLVLLDAPCSATGTIRRHPDIPHRKGPEDIAELAALQARLLDQAVTHLKPGGTLIYCTCSLEPEEGEQQMVALLTRRNDLRPLPFSAKERWHREDWAHPDGWLRTLPCHPPSGKAEKGGMDGFFIARLQKLS